MISVVLTLQLHWVCQLPDTQAREGIKGRFWFMEADMKQTQTLRPDKTGKALLTVLRHLGRLHEVWQLFLSTHCPVIDLPTLSISHSIVLRGHTSCSGALISMRLAFLVLGSVVEMYSPYQRPPSTLRTHGMAVIEPL